MSVLEVRDLQVWFDMPEGPDVHAVRGIDLSVGPGQRFGLVGESGSGKTTAMLALMGLLPPNASVAGTVKLGGRDILAGGEAGAAEYRWTEIAMVFQGAMSAFSPVRTIGWQIVEPMRVHGIASGKQAGLRTEGLLERVGLPGSVASRYPHELSGGQRQRAAIAMALACDPSVLLADEPTTALDVMVQAQIMQLLQDLSQELDLSLVMVSHDLPVISESCHEIAVMYAGQIVETGQAEQLVTAPRHPYTTLLFEAVPKIGASESDDGAVVSIPGQPPRLDQPIIGCAFAPRCPWVMDECLGVSPVLAEVRGDGLATGQRVSCHLKGPPLRDLVLPVGKDVERMSIGDDPVVVVDDLFVAFAVRRSIPQALKRQAREVVRAVDGVSLTAAAGEMVGIVGESGSGKTTTAQTILGNLLRAGGAVSVSGQDLATLPPKQARMARRAVQAVFQDPYESLDPRFTVRQIVSEPLEIHGEGGRHERLQRVRDALDDVGLSPADTYLDRYPHQLSGGQRQRVAIAAALVLDPQILIADEPVSMLDVSVRAEVLALLDRLRRERQLAVIFITHDLSTAAHFCDRIYVMYLGRVVETGPAGEVVHSPQHPYTQALLSVIPTMGKLEAEKLVLVGEIPDPRNIPSGCRFEPRCPRAIDACRGVDPTLASKDISQPNHESACILDLKLLDVSNPVHKSTTAQGA